MSETKHGRSYGLCKKILAANKIDKDIMLSKFEVIFLGGGLTEDDYKELVSIANGGNQK